MKRFLPLSLAIIMCFSMCSCKKQSDDESNNDDKSYYSDTELEQLETFTSITGIELNISQDAPESNSVIYNYIMDNDANGVGAIVKYEAYLEEYGFEKADELSTDDYSAYKMDEYVIVTGSFVVQSNILQYIISIPSNQT